MKRPERAFPSLLRRMMQRNHFTGCDAQESASGVNLQFQQVCDANSEIADHVAPLPEDWQRDENRQGS